ncbi:MAG: hemolysin family protein [Gemmatimonadales bacterium]
MNEPGFGSLVLRLGGVLLLVVVNALFVAAEFSLVASRRTRIEAMIRKGDLKAKLARRAISSMNRMISGTQLGITLASLGLGWIGEPAVAMTIQRLAQGLDLSLSTVAVHSAATLIAFMLITFLHIVLGELTPKALGLLYPEIMAGWLSGPLIVFAIATNPFIWLLNTSANLVLKTVGVRAPSKLDRLHSPEELRMLVEQSGRAGALDRDDARLLAGVFEFSEKNAREVMTPRTQMTALHVQDAVADAADVIAKAGRSRYPVYRESLDDIVGIIHAKDVLKALRRPPGEVTLESLMRPVHFVPSSREIEDVLADMKLRKAHMVIVLDEFGGTAGLVTMEDLLEEIVGQIEDEYDQARDRAPRGSSALPAPKDTGAALFQGSAELADVAERLHLSVESGDYTTLGGYLFGVLGRLPKVGDRVSVNGGSFEVTAMDGRRVAEARFTAAAQSPARP